MNTVGSTMRWTSLVVLAVVHGGAMAQPKACRVEPFQGATLPQGATATMLVVSGGPACAITNFGVPAGRRNPAESGAITSNPQHGVATFSAPKASYKPDPGYVGEDEFTYEAYAKGNIDQQIHLRVRVKVTVTAP